MALGYEGWVKLGNTYVLGTGASAPRARVRLDSTSGYGGKINSPVTQIGIGAPHNYDWIMWDGSLNFDVSHGIWDDELHDWPFDRQSSKSVIFSSRKENVQSFDEVWFNSISLSASEDSPVDGSLGFTAIERSAYTFGETYISNKFGNLPDDGTGDQTPLCTLLSGFPPPLNGAPESQKQYNPVPYWFTRIEAEGSPWEFLSWDLQIAQPVETFFGCNHSGGADPGVQEPLFLATGPMTVTLSGTIMQDVLVDDLDDMLILIADRGIMLKRLELQNQSDDVQSGESLVIQNVEYEAYEIE
jgi:hypothetical protein